MFDVAQRCMVAPKRPSISSEKARASEAVKQDISRVQILDGPRNRGSSRQNSSTSVCLMKVMGTKSIVFVESYSGFGSSRNAVHEIHRCIWHDPHKLRRSGLQLVSNSWRIAV